MVKIKVWVLNPAQVVGKTSYLPLGQNHRLIHNGKTFIYIYIYTECRRITGGPVPPDLVWLRQWHYQILRNVHSQAYTKFKYTSYYSRNPYTVIHIQ